MTGEWGEGDIGNRYLWFLCLGKLGNEALDIHIYIYLQAGSWSYDYCEILGRLKNYSQFERLDLKTATHCNREKVKIIVCLGLGQCRK